MLTFFDGWPMPPPPPCPDCSPPGPVEGFLAFMLAYMLLVMGVIVFLPPRWTDWIFFREPVIKSGGSSKAK